MAPQQVVDRLKQAQIAQGAAQFGVFAKEIVEAGPFVMAVEDLSLVFEGVAEGDMGDVMDQHSHCGYLGRSRVDGVAGQFQLLDDALGHGQAAKGVIESGMNAAGVDQIGGAQLFDAAQPLHLPCVQHAGFPLGQKDVAVYGIAQEHGRRSFEDSSGVLMAGVSSSPL